MPKCLVCGKPVNHYFCSVKCSHKYDEMYYPEKKCLVCGRQLYHDGLSESDFQKRKLCSRSCAAIYSRNKMNNSDEAVKVKNNPSNVVATVNKKDATILIRKDGNQYYWTSAFKSGTVLTSYKFSCIEQVYADIALAF